jgi:hypothetical protein
VRFVVVVPDKVSAADVARSPSGAVHLPRAQVRIGRGLRDPEPARPGCGERADAPTGCPLRFDDLEHLKIAVLQRVGLHAPGDVLPKVEVDGPNLHRRCHEVAWETVHLHARAEDPCIIAEIE